MPLNYEEDANIEDEGMIGKIINDARKNHNEANERFDKIQTECKDAFVKIQAESKDAFEKNQAAIKDAYSKMESIKKDL